MPRSPTSGAERKDVKMALFKRADLKEKGLTDEQIDWIMTEGNRSLSANYTLTSDVQPAKALGLNLATPVEG
jgi:hypothetical protein